MDSARLGKIRDVFDAVADAPPADRAARLATLCNGDTALMREVESLLAAQSHAGTFLNTPAAALPQARALLEGPGSADALIGQTFGQYRITALLGEGGMGVVYRAEQEHPRRAVALKLIRSPFISASLLRRFEHEASILARLKHPGIAQIFEAGSIPGDRGRAQPFFAMELVEGPPLLEFARSRNLSTRLRLQLFALICDAVEHAHQKGIIHRDLKPGNILVEASGIGHQASAEDTARKYGSSSANAQCLMPNASPKILDFGVARATDSAGGPTLTTMQTGVGQVIGTLQYMSPEQVRGDTSTIDTRSDVYALGVILFEFLTGKLPYDLRGRSLPDAARIIGEDDPARVSLIERRLRGDVETIVAKALEKDPDRRYPSAAALGADIRRFLDDRPIIARPASTTYQLSKFARRNKALVGGVIATFIALLAGIIGTTSALLRAKEAEHFALAKADEARVAADQAQIEAENANAVALFMQRAFESAHPGRELHRGTVTTIDEFLEFASERIDEWSKGRPEVHARLLEEVGAACTVSGRYERALTLLTRAVEIRRTLDPPDPVRLAGALQRLGDVYRDTGDHHRKADAYFAALTQQRKANLADPTHMAMIIMNVAEAYGDAGDYARAEALFQEAADSLQDTKAAITLRAKGLNSLAGMLEEQGRYAESERMLRTVLDLNRQTSRGDTSSDEDAALCNLAWVLYRQGRLDEAEPLARRSVAGKTAMFKPGHLRIATGLITLGVILQARGNFTEAEPLLREALESRIKFMSKGSGSIAAARVSLAECLARSGNRDEAESLLNQAASEGDSTIAGMGLSPALKRDIESVRELLRPR